MMPSTIQKMIEMATLTKPRMIPVSQKPLAFGSLLRPMKPRTIPATPKRKPIPQANVRTMPRMPPTSDRMLRIGDFAAGCA